MQGNRLAVILAILIGVVFLFAQTAFAVDAKTKGEARRKTGDAGKIAKKLNLTAEQKSKMKAIRADAKKQIEAVQADKNITAEAKKTKIGAIRQDTAAKTKAVLTPEQQAQWAKMHGGKRDGGAVDSKNDIFKGLNLTEGQQAKIKAIRADAAAQIQKVKADVSLKAEAKAAKVKEINQAAKKKMLLVLTPEQRAKIKTANAGRAKAK